MKLTVPAPECLNTYVDAALDLHGYTLDNVQKIGVYSAFSMTVAAIAPMLTTPLSNEDEPASPYQLPA